MVTAMSVMQKFVIPVLSSFNGMILILEEPVTHVSLTFIILQLQGHQVNQAKDKSAINAKDFYANEEYNGLCSGCFKKLTIEESQQKPQFSQPQHVPVQPTPIQANNNAEPVADKCKVCRDFHGDV